MDILEAYRNCLKPPALSELQIDISAGDGKQAKIQFVLSGWGLLWMREHASRRLDERILQWLLWPLPLVLLRWMHALIRPLRVVNKADWRWSPVKRVYFSAAKSVSVDAPFGSAIEVRGLNLLGVFYRRVEVPMPDEQVPQLDRAAFRLQLANTLRPQLNALLGVSQREGVQLSSQLVPVLHASHPWGETARFHPLTKLPKIKIETGEMPATVFSSNKPMTQLHKDKTP